MVAKTFDLDAVQSFTLLASLANFTRVAEATGTTQSAVSLKLKRLESFLGRRLVERTPRSVRLTPEGAAFLEHAKAMLAANDRALAVTRGDAYQLRLGVSDHAAGPELPTLLAKLGAADPGLTLELNIGFSRPLLDAFDKGKLDGVIVRREGSHRGGEALADDEFAWFAAPSFAPAAGEPLRLANLAPPCGVRALAVRALETARIPWNETFLGGGIAAVCAAVSAGIAVAPLARRIAPIGSVDVGGALKLPRLPKSRVMLYSRVSDPRAAAALRTLAAAFRAKAGG
ncbi:MAG TPA: LysR family transcriptional regulator [Pseudolabrys sp.]|nr:LysR family transcriptional regulator [Pseudolabrys sp.]